MKDQNSKLTNESISEWIREWLMNEKMNNDEFKNKKVNK